MEASYYKILGVDEKATADEIKKEYRKIAKKYHPDINPGDKVAEEKFREIAEAYAVLGDQDKRKAYDKKLSLERGTILEHQRPNGKKARPQGMEGFDFGNMSSNFEQFFGFRPGTNENDEEILNTNKKTKANPIDMTEMFERYMGMKK